MDSFSARWTRTQAFTAGTYTFSAGADDGVRLFVDGVKVIDSFIVTGYVARTATVGLTAGPHTIVMEYNELGGVARATLGWTSVPGATCPATVTGWKAEYFTNETLAGLPAVCRDEASVNTDWAFGSPAANIPVDNFSARWTRTQAFTAGSYTFTAGADDGVRLFVDGAKVIDSFIPTGGYFTRTATVGLTAGPHTIVMEYNELFGVARATLAWTRSGWSTRTASRWRSRRRPGRRASPSAASSSGRATGPRSPR